jgi:imidazoleglycerol phosphate dehydratase HisB
MKTRSAAVRRATAETDVTVELSLDGTGKTDINTGIGFYDHLLTALAKHARFDLVLRCRGDIDVDDHHTVEDCALVLGQALDQALGDRRGIRRFGFAFAPLDEALARAVIDLSGRPWAEVRLDIRRERIGALSGENVAHAVRSMATAARLCVHLDIERGENDHHKAEAAFKALALALREAVSVSGYADVPSTKGTLGVPV